MKQHDKLFELIKSLSKSEKRNFKLFTSKYSKDEESNYEKLFNAIDSQIEYDEVKIKDHFKNEKFIKQLTVTKSYLYNLILEALRSTSFEVSVDMQVKDLLKDVEILYSKALYAQCYPILFKAKKIAEKNEIYTSLLEIIEWEQKVKMREAEIKNLDEHLQVAHAEEMELIQIIDNRLHLKFLARQMLLLSRKIWVANTAEDLAPFNELMKHEALSDESKTKSFMALFDFYNCYSIYHRIKDEPEKLYEYRKKGLQLMDSNPEYRDAHPESYFVAINNFVYACINSNHFNEALEILPMMTTISASQEDLSNLILSSSRNLELAIYFHLAEFQKGVDKLEELTNKFGDLDRYMIPTQITAYYFYNSNLYFGMGDFKKALYWINKVLTFKEEGYRQDIHRFARILNLLIHYELNNMEQLEYFIKATYRFLYSRARLFHAETLVFDFIKKSSKVHNKSELKELFEIYHELFSKLLKDKYEKNIFNHIDLITWLESKISGTQYGELAYKKRLMQLK